MRWMPELRAALTPEWQSSRALFLATGAPRTTVPVVLNHLLRRGVAERRGGGVIGNGYEWRLAAEQAESPEVKP